MIKSTINVLQMSELSSGVIWRDTLKVSKNFLRFKMPVSVLWRDTKVKAHFCVSPASQTSLVGSGPPKQSNATTDFKRSADNL